MPDKEKPFTMSSWDDLRRELAAMKPRSKLFLLVEAEVKKRGHWRRLPRGIHTDKNKDKST